MKIAAKMTDLNENSAKFCKNHEKIAKINGAKDCKFEFRAVQRNANLVDLILYTRRASQHRREPCAAKDAGNMR